MPSIPVLKEGVKLWFLESVNGDIVLRKDTVVSACVVSDITSSGDVKSEVRYYIKNTGRFVCDHEIGKKYFLSKYDLFSAMMGFKEDSKDL